MTALYMAPGTEWLRPRTLDDRMLRVPTEAWTLGRARWDNHMLRLSLPGHPYSILVIWDEAWSMRFWYINMEEPQRRSDTGFDYMDWALDVVVPPGMDMAEWKDEDELRQFIDKGLLPAGAAEDLRDEAERALEWLQSRRAPFDERWEDWRPDPAWRIPELPERWE